MAKIILIGGFLGSGKTTLLSEVAGKLTKQNKNVGLITNDQAPDLVDTRLLTPFGQCAEVSGSCFCCNFNGFIKAVQSLVEQGAEYIVAEPVGSCTDLSATIINPLKKFHPEWSVAPLTVLIDPQRFYEVLGKVPSKADPDAVYIMKLQMDEADRILVNKQDTLPDEERQSVSSLLKSTYPNKKTNLLSAKTGAGIDDWLADILVSDDAGQTLADVDYDRYAHGEAVLGWLNAAVSIADSAANSDMQSADILANLFGKLQSELRKSGSEVGHIKAVLQIGKDKAVANLTSIDGTTSVQNISANTEDNILIFNARVQMPPEQLETLVRNLLQEVILQNTESKIDTLRCLMPGRPNPTHRFSDVI